MIEKPIDVAWALAIFGWAVSAISCAQTSDSPDLPRPTPTTSVLVVVLDTVRADRLDSTAYPTETMPALREFGRSAATFRRAVAASPWTGPSVASILTGYYPDQLGLTQLWAPLHPDAVTLAERLGDAGYTTGAVISNGFLAPAFGMDQGYEFYEFAPYTNPDIEEDVPTFTADRVTDAALSWLEGVGSPFFLYVHYTDPHAPYLPPEPYRNRFVSDPSSIDETLLSHENFSKRELTDSEATMVRQMYDAELAFLDTELARLLGAIGPEVLVVVTSDHGEEFQDHGGFLHGHTVYEELVHVPLIVRAGSGCSGCSIDQVVAHVDLTPTILDLVGIEPPEDLSGRSLASLLDGTGGSSLDARIVYSIRQWRSSKTVAARRENWKLVSDGSQAVLFDLKSDPDETYSWVGEHRSIAEELVRALQTRDSRPLVIPELEDSDWQDERIRQLENLGYI